MGDSKYRVIVIGRADDLRTDRHGRRANARGRRHDRAPVEQSPRQRERGDEERRHRLALDFELADRVVEIRRQVARVQRWLEQRIEAVAEQGQRATA